MIPSVGIPKYLPKGRGYQRSLLDIAGVRMRTQTYLFISADDSYRASYDHTEIIQSVKVSRVLSSISDCHEAVMPRQTISAAVAFFLLSRE